MTRDEFESSHETDEHGNPAGGKSTGLGFEIEWQDGPLGPNKEENGAFVENVVLAVRDRLDYYEGVAGGKFSCRENRMAIDALNLALDAFTLRRVRRKAAGKAGTHAVD